LVLTQVHRGVTPEMAVEATGWELKLADVVGETPPPTAHELEVLRALKPSEESDIGRLISARAAATV